MNTTTNPKVRRMVQCALLAALTAVCSQIQVPLPGGVPVNLALFSVYMAGTLLGPVWGTASQLVFVLLAAVGVPVLAGFSGGPAVLFGKTGGYIIGYLLAALIVGWFSQNWGRKPLQLAAAMVLGCAGCYFLGTCWFMVVTGADLVSSLTWCVIPFLPGDAVKIVLASMLTTAIDRRMPRGLL